MKRNPARMLLCAGLCAAAVIGTGVMSYAASWSSSGSETAQTDNRMTPRDDGSVMAKITAAGDGSLTVTFALKPEQRMVTEPVLQKTGRRTGNPRRKNRQKGRHCRKNGQMEKLRRKNRRMGRTLLHNLKKRGPCLQCRRAGIPGTDRGAEV